MHPPWKAAKNAGLALAAGALLAAMPAGAGHPSPADWRDVPIYQVFTDRFYDGDPANNNLEGSYDPGDASGHPSGWDPGNVHGGDLAGVLEKLDYIQALGFRAVWISPVQLNKGGAHHGYHAKDLMAIAPHFGTEAELRALADELHARGMYLILDVVCNHMGDFITSNSSGYPGFSDPSSYVMTWHNAERPAAPFDDLSWYHNNGHIFDYGDSVQAVLGELAALDDLDTANPAVRQALIDAFTWLIDVSDCDGFRVDTIKHTDVSFWQEWCPALRAHAASVGKNNFFMFGEAFDGSDYHVGKYTGTQSGGAFAFDSALYFPMHWTLRDVFAYDQPTRWINYRYDGLPLYDPAARDRLVYFLDNHDVSRFLTFGVANQEWDRLEAALGFLTTTRGVPLVYQGTEQGFDGGSDPYDREDMWDGEWEYGPSVGDNFNMTHPLYLYLSRILDVRRRYDALRTGTFVALDDDGSGPGIYAFRRDGVSENVVVAINSDNASTVSGSLGTGWAAGTPVSDLLDPGFAQNAGAGGGMQVQVPARGTRILVRTSAVTPHAPRVVVSVPPHDSVIGDGQSPLRLAFDRPMDHSSVEAAFTLDPLVPGTFSWEGDSVMVFTPLVHLAAGGEYRMGLAATAEDTGGEPLRAAFASTFRVGSQTGLGGEPLARPLLQAFPNPAGDRLQFSFSLEQTARVSVEVFDVRGRRVAESPAVLRPAGEGQVRVSRSRLGLPRGVYFARLRVEGESRGAVRVVWR